jgi:twitching motility protein PilT
MTTGPLVDRLLQAARQKGGDRLELVSGRAAVLVDGGNRLQAGNAVVAASDLEAWLESAVPTDRWLSFQLGEEISTLVEVSGVSHPLRARQAGGVTQAAIELAPTDVSAPRPTMFAAAPSKAPDGAVAPGGTPLPQRPQATGAPGLDRPLDRLLRRLVEVGGSDLHLASTRAPMIRLHGEMQPFPDATVTLSSEHILLMCEEVAPAQNRREFRDENDTDFAYEIPQIARFRVNVFRDRHGVGAVFRQIPTQIRSIEELGLPDCVKSLCMLNKGLVLVTGPTGSGKSTTLASMIDYLNERRTDHIITIEDPIEFVHESKRCLVNQREVNSHTGSFKRALRAALREDPDVVLVGELRDLETMAIAIETAETGHLVFGTLHTTTAVSTIDRLIDQFPADRQDQIRIMLSESLKGVIAQILLRRRGGGRVAAYEILLGIPAVANLIREGKTFQVPSIMQTHKRLGMRLMNDALAELVKRDVVEVDEALGKSVDKDGLRGLLKLDRSEPSA